MLIFFQAWLSTGVGNLRLPSLMWLFDPSPVTPCQPSRLTCSSPWDTGPTCQWPMPATRADTPTQGLAGWEWDPGRGYNGKGDRFATEERAWDTAAASPKTTVLLLMRPPGRLLWGWEGAHEWRYPPQASGSSLQFMKLLFLASFFFFFIGRLGICSKTEEMCFPSHPF